MAVELKVPEVGESITEVQIGEWVKKEGDEVQQDDIVCMIETDKVTVELPAPVSGVISEIKVREGEGASVGDVIGYMEEGKSGAKTSSASESRRHDEKADDERAEEPRAPQPATRKDAPTARDEETKRERAGDGDSAPSEGFARVMPSARRAMAEAGLSPEDVEGTGPGGRILKEDVERARQQTQRDETKQEEQPERSEPSPRETEPPPAPAPRVAAGAREEEVVAMSPMRKRIAERLVQSQQQAALLTTFNEIDMSAVMALRKEYQPQFQEKNGIKLGFMSFFVKGAIEALKLIPQVNAEVRGTDVVYKNYYDIGVAVGGGKGLVVPVIRNAERLSFAEIELTIADLARRAQKNKLKLDELQGGTFTISNGGVYGSLLSTPIINPPQSGVLGMHSIQQRPVALDGKVEIRPMMYVALTYDHRIVDGREAVTFLKRIKECVEAPSRILLEV